MTVCGRSVRRSSGSFAHCHVVGHTLVVGLTVPQRKESSDSTTQLWYSSSIQPPRGGRVENASRVFTGLGRHTRQPRNAVRKFTSHVFSSAASNVPCVYDNGSQLTFRTRELAWVPTIATTSAAGRTDIKTLRFLAEIASEKEQESGVGGTRDNKRTREPHLHPT